MSVEKLQEYIDSLEELKKAYTKVREYGGTISDTGRYLNNFPYKMTVSNVQVGFQIVAEREYTLNGDDWPTAKQLAEALSDYISKRSKSKTLYQSLTEPQRGTIQPHPDI